MDMELAPLASTNQNVSTQKLKTNKHGTINTSYENRKEKSSVPVNCCPQINFCMLTSHVTRVKLRSINLNSTRWKRKCNASKGKMIYISATESFKSSESGENSSGENQV